MRSFDTFCSVAMSQIRTVPSLAPVASRRPSGLRATCGESGSPSGPGMLFVWVGVPLRFTAGWPVDGTLRIACAELTFHTWAIP